MSLDDFSNITVTADGPALTQVGFGTLLLCASKVPAAFTERTRTYTALAQLTADGFRTDWPAYRMAKVAFSQSPRPTKVKIGRLANKPVQSVKVTPLAVDGVEYRFTADVGPLSEDVSYTSDSSATVDEICDGIQAAVAAKFAGVTVGTATDSVAVATGAKTFTTQTGLYLPVGTPIVATSALGSGMTGTVASYNVTTGALVITVASVTGSGTDTDWVFTATYLVATPDGGTATYLSLTTTSGEIFALSAWDRSRLKVEDLTPDPGIQADLDAIVNADGDFYGIALELNARAISSKAADWTEAQIKLLSIDSADWQDSTNGNSTDIQSVLHGLSYSRTLVTAKNDQGTYHGVGALAERLPSDPGSPPSAGGTFHAKTIAGVPVDTWTPTEQGVLKTKGFTIYTVTAGLNLTQGGKSADGEFFDYPRFVDWFRIRLQEKIVQAQANNDRIGMTDAGIAVLLSCAKSQLKEGLRSGGVAPTLADGVTPPSATAPALSDVSSVDRAARNLGGGGLVIAFRYSGAIHFVDVGINVSV